MGSTTFAPAGWVAYELVVAMEKGANLNQVVKTCFSDIWSVGRLAVRRSSTRLLPLLQGPYLIALYFLLASCSAEKPPVAQAAGNLSIFFWFEYIPQELLDKFAAETGIEVTMDTYTSNEAMLASLKAGKLGTYDVAVPSDYMVQIMIQEGMLDEIGPGELTNAGDLRRGLRLRHSSDLRRDLDAAQAIGCWETRTGDDAVRKLSHRPTATVKTLSKAQCELDRRLARPVRCKRQVLFWGRIHR